MEVMPKPNPTLSTVISTAALLMTAFAAVAGWGGTPPKTLAVVDGYRSWRKVTPHPYHVTDVVATLCAAPTPVQVAKMNLGPHNATVIDVYVNKIGEAALVGKGKTFPAGSVIVKEKHAAEGGPITLMTVMQKGPKGSRLSTGDWTYYVTDANGVRMSKGAKLDRCASCHDSVKANDYVFRTYLDHVED